MVNFERRLKYTLKLQELEQFHPPASKQGRGGCCRSVVCCWRRPGALDQDDIGRIADHLGKTPQELFRENLIVDDFGHGLLLLPRRKQQAGGRMITSAETYDIDTPCVFLGESNACEIHDVKPSGCRNFMCWSKQSHPEPIWQREELVSLGWDGVNPDEEGL